MRIRRGFIWSQCVYMKNARKMQVHHIVWFIQAWKFNYEIWKRIKLGLNKKCSLFERSVIWYDGDTVIRNKLITVVYTLFYVNEIIPTVYTVYNLQVNYFRDRIHQKNGSLDNWKQRKYKNLTYTTFFKTRKAKLAP